ncbi:response regulator transcription factor [Streptomyces heilongjiangensis]
MISSSGPLAVRPRERVTSVMIIDDEDLLRSGLKQALEQSTAFDVVAEAAVGRDAIAVMARKTPDVVVLGVAGHQEAVALDLIARLSAAPLPVRPKVLLLADQQVLDRSLTRAIHLGVRGILLRSVSGDELLYAVRQVSCGHSVLQPLLTSRLFAGLRHFAPVGAQAWRGGLPDVLAHLSPRERDVLTGIARGMSNQEMAEDFHLTVATVKSHVSSILTKLGARDRLQVALLCIQYGLFSEDE